MDPDHAPSPWASTAPPVAVSCPTGLPGGVGAPAAEEGYSIRGYTLYRRVVHDPDGPPRPMYAFLRHADAHACPAGLPEGHRVVFDGNGRPGLQRVHSLMPVS